MPRSLGRIVALVAVLLGVLTVAACGGDSPGFSGHRLKNPWKAPDIALTATDGSSYSLAKDTTENPLTLVFFGYTHCPDICPLVMNQIAAAFNRLDEDEAAETGMVFVTSDPARDDEATLRRYLDGYNKDFMGLTGPVQKIIALGKPLHVYVSNGKKLPGGGYDLGSHSTFVLGLEHGKAVALWDQNTSAPEYADDIHTLLSEED